MNSTLESLHAKELEIFETVAEICDKLNLGYIMTDGTLIGSVRHKGFIPWDDDIDLKMPRDDYERFLRVAPAYLPENLIIQHYTTEKNASNLFIKIVDVKTTFIPKKDLDEEFAQGIFIDIFPVDRISDKPLAVKYAKLRNALYLTFFNLFDREYAASFTNPAKRAVSLLLHKIFRKIGRYRFFRFEDKYRKKRHAKGGAYAFAESISQKHLIKFDVFTKRAKLPFEGKEFWGVGDYDTYLSAVFGDYMQLPPPEARINHSPEYVDTEKSYKEYISAYREGRLK